MKGYNNRLQKYEPRVELTLVGCKRCYEVWYEEHMHHSGVRLNGPWYLYDYCDKCAKPSEPKDSGGEV